MIIGGGAAAALWLVSQRRQTAVSDQPATPSTPPPPAIPSPAGAPRPAEPAPSSPAAPAPPGPTSSVDEEIRETPAPDAGGARVRAEVLQRLERYRALFDQAAAESGIPAAWLLGIAAAESGGNPDSGKGGTGYKGIMQARRTVDQLDPATSIKTGAEKLKDFRSSVQKRLGARYAALAPLEQLRVLATAYNAGPGTVYKALDYARDAGDVALWRDAQPYTRALIFYGAYSTRAYAPKGTAQSDIDQAERWRLDSRSKGLTLDELRGKGAPELVLRAIREKHARTAPYLDKIEAYARHYSAPAVA